MLGLLSDAHGNLPGFLKGLTLLQRHGARRFAFLGDAVGYIPSWDVVDELARRQDDFVFVLGNHEEMLLSGALSARDSVYRHGLLRHSVTPERIGFLQSWRTSITLDLPCGVVLLVHGSPNDTQNGYLYPDSPLEDLRVDGDFLFCGHTHRPFVTDAAGARITNVGSCGLPRDDGRFGSVALLDEKSGGVTVIRYDLERDTALYLDRFQEVDLSVANLLARRTQYIFGNLHV